MGNKQGPICFVGQFGDDATATACTRGKVCQVNNREGGLWWFLILFVIDLF